MTEPAMETVDSFGMTAERQFADLWSRTVLSVRERRLLLLGLLVGQGLDDLTRAELDTALRTGDLSESELREVVVFLTHYAGWTRGSRLNDQVEELIERVRQARSGRADPAG
ncbi:MAG: carboxymuconolactone decarboxylase family protein [Nonomuraea sp.]|nr:carboxymuconolactone decarboxylase family protein [Nonomuraea sp.]NUP65710.1 carboxymuconolactone decarboxylase family protein [Nonomuraea sp.]NUP81719.1 carboxymuconolactone decarboxylase family protein [Nonomuraea sp.]NUS07530.1 carboxymuconolactone decarboxylase family protein [Nonomuraea sp.]NUT11314.1 carboxymuconolactone decarboxylase family protein [Nonomuraea sp.]